MKRKTFRLFSCFLVLVLIVNIVFPSISCAVLGTAATTALGGTATAVSGGGVIAGYVMGGVGVSTATYVSSIDFLANMLICGGMAFSSDLDKDMAVSRLITAYKKENDINNLGSLRDVAQLRKLEYGGHVFDVAELSPQCQQILLNYYYSAPSTGTDVSSEFAPNLLLDYTTVSSGVAVDEDGYKSPLLFYDPESGKIKMCEVTTHQIMSARGSNLGSSISFDPGTSSHFTIPYRANSSSSDTSRINVSERPQSAVDYYNTEMWRASAPFAAFVDNNPISCIVKLDDMQVENDSSVVDSWQKCDTLAEAIEFRPIDDIDCPTYKIYVAPNTGFHGDITIEPTCAECLAKSSHTRSKYAYGSRLTAMDYYIAIGPQYSYSSTTGYSLKGINLRVYYPDQYSGSSFDMTSVDCDFAFSSYFCDDCKQYYRTKFLSYDPETVKFTPAPGCAVRTIVTTSNSGTWNVPDFTDSTKRWAMAVESGATYEDLVNGDATLEWVDLNSVGTITDLGNISSSQFVELPVIANTGSVLTMEDEPVVIPASDNPDFSAFEEIAQQIQEWIQGGISFDPSIIGNVAIGAGGAFDSLSDAIVAGTFTGIQISNIEGVSSALNSNLAASSDFLNSSAWPHARSPNILDLLFLIMRVLYASICLVIRALIFIATLSSITASSSILPTGFVQGVEWFKTLSWGNLNLWSLIVWFCSIMFGLSIVSIIRKHYRT